MRIATIAAACAAALVACREPAPRSGTLIPPDLIDKKAPEPASAGGTEDPTPPSGYTGDASVKDLLADLLYQARGELPTADALRERYEGRALARPVNGKETTYELDGDVRAMTIRENASGVGASVQLTVVDDQFVERRALADVESIVDTKRGRFLPPGQRSEAFIRERPVGLQAGLVGCVELGAHVMQVWAEVTQLSGVKAVLVRFERQRRC